jgi:hypothetical protein
MPSPTSLTTVTTATLAGGSGRNQDHAVVTDHAVAVLDGATSWLPQDPDRDGGWYARALGAELTGLLVDDVRTLAELVAEGIGAVRDRYRLTPPECPSSTVSVARWVGGALDLYTLGDSPAVVFPAGGDPVMVFDDQLERVGQQQRAGYREHLRAGAGYDDDLAALVADLQRAERAVRNRDGGYWIAGSDPAAAAHGVTAGYPLDQVDAVLLASDGAAADVTEYGRNTWADVYHLVTHADPGDYLRSVHDAEEADYNGTWWPRAKRHDDKTIALVRWQR